LSQLKLISWFVVDLQALYDYVAPEGPANKKLSFKAGDNLLVLQQDKSGWWLAELNKQRGWVPSSYLSKK